MITEGRKVTNIDIPDDISIVGPYQVKSFSSMCHTLDLLSKSVSDSQVYQTLSLETVLFPADSLPLPVPGYLGDQQALLLAPQPLHGTPGQVHVTRNQDIGSGGGEIIKCVF